MRVLMLPRGRATRYQGCRMNPGTSEWWLIEKEFAALWPSLRPCLILPKNPSKAGRPRTYDAHLSAEAILRLTYFNQPLREKLGIRIPRPARCTGICKAGSIAGHWNDSGAVCCQPAATRPLRRGSAPFAPNGSRSNSKWGRGRRGSEEISTGTR